MGRVLPILFNGDMVRAILNGRKTVTRRAVKYKYGNTELKIRQDKYGTSLIEIQKDIEGETHGKNPDGSTWHKLLGYIEKEPPCRKGDILYVRETWAFMPCIECMMDYDGKCLCNNIPITYEDEYSVSEGCFMYKADFSEEEKGCIVWRPSIHMPKQAARIWLKVTDVRVERIQDISLDDCVREGIDASRAGIFTRFSVLWDSTIKKTDIGRYDWDANPWVWVIEFNRCEKSESEGLYESNTGDGYAGELCGVPFMQRQ